MVLSTSILRDVQTNRDLKDVEFVHPTHRSDDAQSCVDDGTNKQGEFLTTELDSGT